MSSRQIVRPTLLLLTVLVVMVVPVTLVEAVGWSSASMLASLAAVSAVFNLLSMGLRGLYWGTVTTGIAIFLAVLSAENPWASAAVMAMVGLSYGWANYRGLSSGNVVLPMVVAATIGMPPSLSKSVLINSALSLGVTVFSMLIAGVIFFVLMRKQILEPHEFPRYSRKVNGVYTFNITLLWAIIGYISSAHHAQVQGMWLALTVALIVRPYIDVSLRKGAERAGGTILGFLIALGVATAVPAGPLYFAIGLIFIELAVIAVTNAHDSYWLFVMFLTPGIVLLSGAPSDVTQLADVRLLVTFAAVLASLGLLLIERLLFYKGSLNKEPELSQTK